MKTLFTLFIVLIASLTIQCTGADNISKSQNKLISEPILEAKKTEIINYIKSFDCTGSCNSIAFGAKPCGGPREYLLFSSAVNLAQLQQMVGEFNEMDHQNNIQTNAISDCAVVLPPNNVACINGSCVIVE